MKRRTMSRQRLYDLVWSMPMRDAAATIPMSDVGLKKVCRRHGVPVPARGYWNKVHAGRPTPRKPPLPRSAEGQTDEFEFFAPAPLHGAALEAKDRTLAKVRDVPPRRDAEPTHLHACAAEMDHCLRA